MITLYGDPVIKTDSGPRTRFVLCNCSQAAVNNVQVKPRSDAKNTWYMCACDKDSSLMQPTHLPSLLEFC